MASATIPLPQPFDPLDPDKGLRTTLRRSKARQAVEVANRKLRPGASADRLYRPCVIQGAGACTGGKMVVRAVKGPASRTRLHRARAVGRRRRGTRQAAGPATPSERDATASRLTRSTRSRGCDHSSQKDDTPVPCSAPSPPMTQAHSVRAHRARSPARSRRT